MIGFIDQVPTLPRRLAERGYRSLQTGKWWQGDYRHGGFTEGMTHGDPDRGGRHGDEGLKIGRETMQPIHDFIASTRKEGRPFFVWYAPMLPHQPHNPPERLLGHYRGKTASPHVARYWAICEWFDETCGQLLDELDRQGLAENTLVFYLADNGWIQDPAADQFAPRSKQSPYEGGIRTPIMVRWPGHVAPQRSAHLAISLDIAPTVLAAAGLKPPREMSGVNLLEDAALARRRAIFGECFTHNAVEIHHPASSLRWRWAIEGEWKLILPAPQNEPNARPELYHIGRDPHEETDLAEKEPQVAARLAKELGDWWPGKP
jgi:uncharacterized sulfatase